MALGVKIHNPFSQLCILGQAAAIMSVFMNSGCLFSLRLIKHTDSLKVTSLKCSVCDMSGKLLR